LLKHFLTWHLTILNLEHPCGFVSTVEKSYRFNFFTFENTPLYSLTPHFPIQLPSTQASYELFLSSFTPSHTTVHSPEKQVCSIHLSALAFILVQNFWKSFIKQFTPSCLRPLIIQLPNRDCSSYSVPSSCCFNSLFCSLRRRTTSYFLRWSSMPFWRISSTCAWSVWIIVICSLVNRSWLTAFLVDNIVVKLELTLKLIVISAPRWAPIVHV